MVQHQQSRRKHLEISDVMFSVPDVILFQVWVPSGGPINRTSV